MTAPIPPKGFFLMKVPIPRRALLSFEGLAISSGRVAGCACVVIIHLRKGLTIADSWVKVTVHYVNDQVYYHEDDRKNKDHSLNRCVVANHD